ncbi:PREDICTED: putative leucine-rich repeat-containing protein DDB_G0290503 [Dufourea novaeangliae]|uniref:putative leucine-rich repeat-containing protein DDB_G0290503 n=1 Tax=Dufourea novaeangliae TaxID=178035 RepID=UPI0007672F60|nr:PREDICTED: putative leucine-rich repeat-containing protein DDB_G0290503 [Dufourea novaeangliae]
MISDVLNCESDTDPKNTNGKDSIIVLNVRQNKYNPSEIEFENISNSVHSEQSFNGIADNEYHNYIVKLDRKNNINEIDKELLEYFSHLMIKLQALTQKLQVYLEVERPQMIKQIYNFYEVLKDTESAINESQDLSLRKQRISELYDLYNEKYKNYETYVKQLPNDFSQIQVKIIEFIKTILHQLLNAILYVEKKNSFDKQINQAFEIHLRSCIDRISTALQGAGDRRIQIIEEIEKQQQELQKKDVEITQLKEEVEKQLLRRGEGDGLYSEESIAALKEQLTKLATELNVKDKFILNLREQQEVLRTELFKCNKDSNVLKMQNKNLDNIRDKLLKECEQYKEELEIKNKDVINLTQQLHNIFEIKNLDTEEKIKEMEKELLDLQFENNDLKNKIMQENKIISKKDDTIIQLKNQVERNEHILSFKIAEHKNEMEEKYHEIGNLKDENTLLNKKLKNAENRLSEMNQTILSLTEQNDKIDVIYLLQEDLVKLDKSEKKLKTELNNLKMQLTNDQNKVKKLDNSLNEFERENENLKKNVEYWRSENSVLSLKLSTEESEEKLRSKLYTLSSTIHERLLNFNKKINLEKHASNEQSDDSLKSKYLIYQNLTEEWKSRGNQKREIKENEVENAQNQQLINSTNIKYSSDDSLNIRYNTNHLKNGDIENQNETKNLRNDMEIKDSEMRNLEDAISRLTQENDDLRVHIKFQIQEYQDKLTLMKKNYDSSLNALCKRHKESVGTLQKRFEDIIKGERTFDSENWLQSLDIKKLTELYERITMVINNNSSFIHMKNENQRFYENDMQKEFYKDLNETEKTIHKNICEKDVSNKMASSILREQNTSYLQNQWQFIISSQTQKYPIQTEDYKLNLQQDFGLFDDRKLPRLENKHEKEKEAVKNNTLDQQRWSFINQCSAYHKMSNAVQDPFI